MKETHNTTVQEDTTIVRTSGALATQQDEVPESLRKFIGNRTGKEEITHWAEFDYVIVNKNFDRAYADLGHIYRAERIKPTQNPWLPGFVAGLVEE